MKLKELAKQLRDRQRKKGLVKEEILNLVTDYDMVLSYVICSDCGKREIDDPTLATIIRNSANAEEFIESFNSVMRAKMILHKAEEMKCLN